MLTVKLPRFFVPIKPYTAIDAINRVYAATGSVRLAMASSSANFNGHHNGLDWNEYRKYYVGEYYWGERCVWYRGNSFAEALSYGLREYDRQGKGASLNVHPEFGADLEVCRANPRLLEWSEAAEAAEYAKWQTWQHQHAADFVSHNKRFGGIPTDLYLNAVNYDDYWDKVKAELDQRRKGGTHVVRDAITIPD